jgi:hypothetical protein
LDHLSDHIHLLGNLLMVNSELPEKLRMDIFQEYRQSNHHETAFIMLGTKATIEVFKY